MAPRAGAGDSQRGAAQRDRGKKLRFAAGLALSWRRKCPDDERLCTLHCLHGGVEVDGRIMRGCPLKQVESGCNFWLSLFPAFEDGVLWEPGGLGDQPLQYLQAMNVIRIMRDEMIAEKQKEAEAQAKRERERRGR